MKLQDKAEVGPVSEVGLETKQLTRIKQSQIKQPWKSADALSEPESMHGKGTALSGWT